MYGQNVLDALVASRNPDKIRLAQAYNRAMENHLLPVTLTEQIVDAHVSLYEYLKSTE